MKKKKIVRNRKFINMGSAGVAAISLVITGIKIVSNKKSGNATTTASSREWVNDLSPNGIQVIARENIGTGITARTIAKRLGIKGKTSDGPNVRFINVILTKVGAMCSGYIDTVKEKSNNGGIGQRNFRTPLYKEAIASKVSKYIVKHTKKIGDNLYELHGIQFRK